MTEVDYNGGDSPIIGHFTLTDAAGAFVAADTLPTVAVYDRVGIDVTADLGALAFALSTGHYIAYLGSGTFATTETSFDGPFWAVVTAVVGGISQKIPLPPFDFRVTTNYAKVTADGANTATVFKVATIKGQLPLATNDAVFALATFLSGSLAGQVAEVDSYNHGTGFLTLKRALTAAPTAGDIFRLINS